MNFFKIEKLIMVTCPKVSPFISMMTSKPSQKGFLPIIISIIIKSALTASANVIKLGSESRILSIAKILPLYVLHSSGNGTKYLENESICSRLILLLFIFPVASSKLDC